jgi:hypothetical protein
VTDVLLLNYSVKNVEGQMPILAGDCRTLIKLSKGSKASRLFSGGHGGRSGALNV